MLRRLQRLSLPLLLVGWLVAGATPASAQKVPDGPPRTVHDDADFFSESAVKQANKDIARIKERHHKDVLIETVKQGPKDENYDAWARERARERGVDGLYIVLTEKPKKHLQVEVGNHTREKGLFTRADEQELTKLMLADLKGGKL